MSNKSSKSSRRSPLSWNIYYAINFQNKKSSQKNSWHSCHSICKKNCPHVINVICTIFYYHIVITLVLHPSKNLIAYHTYFEVLISHVDNQTTPLRLSANIIISAAARQVYDFFVVVNGLLNEKKIYKRQAHQLESSQSQRQARRLVSKTNNEKRRRRLLLKMLNGLMMRMNKE